MTHQAKDSKVTKALMAAALASTTLSGCGGSPNDNDERRASIAALQAAMDDGKLPEGSYVTVANKSVDLNDPELFDKLSSLTNDLTYYSGDREDYDLSTKKHESELSGFNTVYDDINSSARIESVSLVIAREEGGTLCQIDLDAGSRVGFLDSLAAMAGRREGKVPVTVADPHKICDVPNLDGSHGMRRVYTATPNSLPPQPYNITNVTVDGVAVDPAIAKNR